MITRTQENPDESTLKQVQFVLDVDGDWQHRRRMKAHVYPNYDDWVRITIPSIGFTLNVEDAKNLHALLTDVLKEFK